MGSTKGARDNRRQPWSGAPDCPVCHQTVSGAPPDSVRCTRGLQAKLRTFGNFHRRFAIIHRTVSGAPEESDSELASFGKPLRYNSPDCPVSQRSNGYFAPTVVCNALNVRQRVQRSRARAGGTPDSLQDLSGAPPDSQAGPHVRAPTVGTQRPGVVAGTPDSVRWRTRLSGAPCDSSLHQTASLVVGVINTPNHPTFKSSKFSHFQPLTRARHSIQDTPK
jgi:hypothetical protein